MLCYVIILLQHVLTLKEMRAAIFCRFADHAPSQCIYLSI